MALELVSLSTDVYMVCLNHALSTEREEIVGLLVGEVDENRVAHVSAVVILRRSDKRKDRVEISPEQLSYASTEAERLANLLHRPMRVLGWYHSHPHITVWPSFVDVRTQASYQMMDDGFIGIIFSVFNEDATTKINRIQMTCFQSASKGNDENTQNMRVEIPLHIVPTNHINSVCLNALIQLPRFLCQEEQIAYQTTNQRKLDFLTRLHNSSVYMKSMCHIAEVICGPLLQMLEARIFNNEIKRRRLEAKRQELFNLLQQVYQENAQSENDIEQEDTTKDTSQSENIAHTPASSKSGTSSQSETGTCFESSPKSIASSQSDTMHEQGASPKSVDSSSSQSETVPELEASPKSGSSPQSEIAIGLQVSPISDASSSHSDAVGDDVSQEEISQRATPLRPEFSPISAASSPSDSAHGLNASPKPESPQPESKTENS